MLQIQKITNYNGATRQKSEAYHIIRNICQLHKNRQHLISSFFIFYIYFLLYQTLSLRHYNATIIIYKGKVGLVP